MSDPNKRDTEALEEFGDFIDDFSEEYGVARLYWVLDITMKMIDNATSDQEEGGPDSSDFRVDDDLF